MKRFGALLLAALVLLINITGALAVEVGETVTAATGGATNVSFGDGFYGLCLDFEKKPADPGDMFTVKPAMNKTPKPLTTICMIMPPAAMIIFIRAVGKPSFSSCTAIARSSLKCAFSSFNMLIFRRRSKQNRPEQDWAMTVAIAAPAMPQ